MNNRYPSVIGTTSVLVLSVLAWPADKVRAQDEPEVGALEEIIVTARRREESLMDTPVSITAFTTAEIEARQMSTAADIDQAVPNLLYRTNGLQNTNAATVFIRGIGQRDFIPTKQPGVGIYVDGGYVATSVGSLTELFDVASIEVLRGPQGTLFGRNTIGGAILINSVRPHEEFEGKIDATFGERSRQELKASVNVPFSDKFFGMFSAMERSVDGWVDTPNMPHDNGLGSTDVQAARAALRYLGESVITDFTLTYSQRGTDGPPSVLTHIFTPYRGQIQQWNVGRPNHPVPNFRPAVAEATGLGLWDERYVTRPEDYLSYESEHYPADSEMYHANLTIEWDITDAVTFKSITTYRDMDDFAGWGTDNSPLPISRLVDITESEQITQEIQFSGVAADGRLDWLAGYFYFTEETLNLDAVHFPWYGIMSGSLVDNESTAVFGQLTYDISERLSLTVGGRSTQERLDNIVDDRFQYIPELVDANCTGECPHQYPVTFAIESGPQPGFEEISRTRIDGYRPFPDPPHPDAAYFLPLAPNGLTETDKDATEPYLSLAYRFNDAVMGYVSYSEGFKGGGFTQRIPPFRVVESFGPESAQVAEVGFKWQGADGRARVTGAAFNTAYEDMQVDITTELGGGQSNAAEATINGFELEAVLQVTPQFMLSGGLGKLDGQYDSLAPTVTLWTLDDVLPNLPETQANVSGVYSAPFAAGELTARLDVSYNDEIYITAQNQIITPSYTLINGSIVYSPNQANWELALQGRNLSDEVYSDWVYLGAEDATIGMTMEPPREVMARFTYRF